MKSIFSGLILCFFLSSVFGQVDHVSIEKSDVGMKLVVNGKGFMINGMNWDYYPIGTNFNYSLWNQPDDIIKSALDAEMGLLKNMGVNAIRQYTGVQPKWIQYIYENYGIYTMINHSFGRYGLTVNGEWIANTEYSDPATQELLISEVTKMVEEYKGTPGLLMYLLGNENNFGLFWGGAETEDIPIQDRKSTVRAMAMYKMFNKAALAMKVMDTSLPIAMCNGDLLFAEIIAEECNDIDIFGVNMYRGVSFGDAFERVSDEFKKPIMFTEFGADAFNAVDNCEDQFSQAYYMVGNWKEIYENAAGLGKAGNSIGGFTFQFSDGWWKYGQTKNLDIHDNNASWFNGGYPRDVEKEGVNNMNEEWFGICAKGPTDSRGLYDLYPRAAYYALREVHQLNPFEDGATIETITRHFDNIRLMDAISTARGDKSIDHQPSEKVDMTAKDILGNPNYRAMSYGGYRYVDHDIEPTLDELKEDMKILSAMGIRIVRTYKVHLPQASNLLKAISEIKKEDPSFEMYVMLGAWIDCKNAWTDKEPNHDLESEDNEAQIAKAVELASQYPDIVKVIAVGNEAMVRWAASYYVQPSIILKWVNHLQDLKEAGKLPKDLWITSSDDFSSWGGGDASYHTEDLEKLVNAVDYISMHTYPYHNTHYNPEFWGVPEDQESRSDIEKVNAAMDRALEFARSQYDSVYSYVKSLGVDKPIHIGETGWATVSNGYYGPNGSKATDEYKEGLYHKLMRKWTDSAGISCFYFEGFNEPWKDANNKNGSENHFGLFTKDGQAKYALWDLVDDGIFEGLTRNGNQIGKTYNGDKEALMKDVLAPPTAKEISERD
ncbi:MAG: hypothetical protein HKN09_01860 [Saprospiraceae bacterium]|nr:hypothetical protein [Saprospiraceae bacterium]